MSISHRKMLLEWDGWIVIILVGTIETKPLERFLERFAQKLDKLALPHLLKVFKIVSILLPY